MTDKDKMTQEPEDPFDRVLRNVLEQTEKLRRIQTDVDALVAGMTGQLEELRENRDEPENAHKALCRLESFLTQVQEKTAEALELSGHIASEVDRGTRDLPRKPE